jgi:drug/metabolite transporter superfamily protein YnfA
MAVTASGHGCYSNWKWLLQQLDMAVTASGHGCYSSWTWLLQQLDMAVTVIGHGCYSNWPLTYLQQYCDIYLHIHIAVMLRN